MLVASAVCIVITAGGNERQNQQDILETQVNSLNRGGNCGSFCLFTGSTLFQNNSSVPDATDGGRSSVDDKVLRVRQYLVELGVWEEQLFTSLARIENPEEPTPIPVPTVQVDTVRDIDVLPTPKPTPTEAPAPVGFAIIQGQATHYGESYNGQTMRCGGIYSSDNPNIAAVSPARYQEWPCGSKIQICGPAGCHTVTRTDACPGCYANLIDLSESGNRLVCGIPEHTCRVTIQLISLP